MTDYTGQMAIGITPEEIRELGIEYGQRSVALECRKTVMRFRNYFEQQLFWSGIHL